MAIYFLRYECSPSPSSEIVEEIGGAYVNCWVQASSADSARASAENVLVEAEWEIRNLEEARSVCEADYSNDDDAIEYYKQALVDGEVYVCHTWPNAPQDDEAVH
jgi:hypothetical protein